MTGIVPDIVVVSVVNLIWLFALTKFVWLKEQKKNIVRRRIDRDNLSVDLLSLSRRRSRSRRRRRIRVLSRRLIWFWIQSLSQYTKDLPLLHS